MKLLCFFVVILGMSLNSYSQTQVGNTLFFDQTTVIDEGETLVVTADTLVLGSSTELTIDGVLEVRSPYVLFAPNAKVDGGGTIHIASPSLIPGRGFSPQMPTVIDGNWDPTSSVNIKVKIEVSNTGNLVLGKLEHRLLEGDNSAFDNFYCGANLSLMADGVCIELRGNRFRLGKDAVLTHFSSKRTIISNNDINSVFSKEMFANSTFEFPVGIEEGDYSPVIVKPEKDAELFVNVIKMSTKANDFSFAERDGGIGRIWGVYASHRVRTTYSFQHNKKNEAGQMRNSDMEVFQYSDVNEWKFVTTNYEGDGRHSTRNLASMVAKVPMNYFSKFAKGRNGPMSNDDHVNLKLNESVVISILKNDKAGDGKIISQKTRLVERPKNGFAELMPSGELKYQVGKSFFGTDSLVYEIVDEYGMTSRSTVFMTVTDGGLFLLSNVLTPNGDGYNDELVFVNKDNLVNLELTIVNRWGDRLYESKDYRNTWDGGGLSGGTYYYIIRGKRLNGDPFYQKGWLLLNK